MKRSKVTLKQVDNLLRRQAHSTVPTMSSHTSNTTSKDATTGRQEEKIPCPECGDTEGHALKCPKSPYHHRNCWLPPLRGTGQNGTGKGDEKTDKKAEKTSDK
jgi:hypothetical protein